MHFFSLQYRAQFTNDASSLSDVKDIVLKASKYNALKEIGGRLTILDPLKPSFIVEQELEGRILDVILLFLKIKADVRVKVVLEVKYGLYKERKFSDWQMKLIERNLLSDLIKHRVLHHSDDKTIFMVEDIGIQRHYALKEVLIQREPTHGLPITNEYDILKTLHSRYTDNEENSGQIRGVCDFPDIFHELVRINMVFPLCQMDLFSCIQHHFDMTSVDNFSTKTFAVLFYQMLVMLRNLKRADIVHRDIKPEVSSQVAIQQTRRKHKLSLTFSPYLLTLYRIFALMVTATLSS